GVDLAEDREVPCPNGQSVSLVAWNLDGGRVALCRAGELAVYEFPLWKPLWRHPKGTEVVSLAWHPDGVHLAARTWDRAGRMSLPQARETWVAVWDTAEAVERFRLKDPQGFDDAVAWSADGKRVATALPNRQIALWDGRTGERVGTLPGHTYEVVSLAWHPNGRRLASGGCDGAVRLWDLQLGREVFVRQP